MIGYFVHEEHPYTVKIFLRTWGNELADRFRLYFYGSDLESDVPPGACIFSDIERLSAGNERWATAIAQHLRTRSDVAVLNDPIRTLRRYELQRRLHAAGINSFRTFRYSEPEPDLHFPVFLRGENDHDGALTGLLHTEAEMEESARDLIGSGKSPDDLLVMEFCDTSDSSGIFRKYSAFRIGDAIVPRLLIFSRNWMLKMPDIVEEATLREERDYLESNPHESELRQVFDLAEAEYGRADYAVLDGRIQVWEVNTNPMLMMDPKKYSPQQVPNQEWFRDRVCAAFLRLDDFARGG